MKYKNKTLINKLILITLFQSSINYSWEYKNINHHDPLNIFFFLNRTRAQFLQYVVSTIPSLVQKTSRENLATSRGMKAIPRCLVPTHTTCHTSTTLLPRQKRDPTIDLQTPAIHPNNLPIFTCFFPCKLWYIYGTESNFLSFFFFF